MFFKMTRKTFNFLKVAILLLIIIVCMMFIYRYLNSMSEDFQNNGGNTQTKNEFVMYKMNWCPYCKRAEPTFNSLSNEFELHNKNITFNVIDCEKNVMRCESRNVDRYPTYILETTNGSKYPYQGPLTKMGLRDFFSRHL
jgi:thiol-disulfide isomerase/thioredoxin